jgi:hypothetical protein
MQKSFLILLILLLTISYGESQKDKDTSAIEEIENTNGYNTEAQQLEQNNNIQAAYANDMLEYMLMF